MRIARTLTAAAGLSLLLLLSACAGQDSSGERGPSPFGPTAAASPTTSAASTAPASTPAGATTSLQVGIADSATSRPTVYVLYCHGTAALAGSTVPHAAAACANVVAVGAAALNHKTISPMNCTTEYGSLVATIDGIVNGTAVHARLSQTNGCTMSEWNSLAPLLGSTASAQ